MPRELAMLKWLAENDKPTPPAASVAMKKPEKVVDLSVRFAASYKAPHRIGMPKAS